MARNSLIAAHERHARIARCVMDKLRAEGLRIEWVDLRNVNGFRLEPVNLRAYGVSILCRPLGYKLAWRDKDYMRRNRDTVFVQWGAADVARLVAYLRGLSTARNPFN